MRLEPLQATLRAIGVGEPTARELAETLWLAAQMQRHMHPNRPDPPTERRPSGPAVASDEPDPESPEQTEQPPPQASVTPQELSESVSAPLEPLSPKIEIHSYSKSIPPVRGLAISADAVQVPKAIALHERLAFQQALRPLLRRVPVQGIGTLDEEATARLAGDHPVGWPWPPVLKPPVELWLDAVVVIDRGASMAIWQDLAAEVVAALTESGVFRQVFRYSMESADRGARARVSDWRGEQRPRAELIDPGNRRAILLISDCVGRIWHSGAAGAMVSEWARCGPVAILQPLPERLWARSGARTIAGRLSAPRACSPNTGLKFTASGGRRMPAGTLVPVLEMSAAWLRRWTRLVAGGPPERAAVTVVAADGRSQERPTVHGGPPTPNQRIRRFRAVASPEAYQLVRYVAMSEPVIEVIRHVQAAMFPRAQPTHLAEVLLSGLLQVVSSSTGRYRFVDGVSAELMETLSLTETLQAGDILLRVSDSVRREIAATHGVFPGLSPGPGRFGISPDSKPFAISVLGSRRLDLARRQAAAVVPAAPAVDAADPEQTALVPLGPIGLADLLAPDNAVMRFLGRQADLAALAEWSQGHGDSVLLLTGAPGIGKSRLATVFADQQRSAGWAVADLRRDPAVLEARRAVRPPGLLIVIDQADVHLDLISALMTHEPGPHPVRILLVARTRGEWWRGLERQDERRLLFAATVRPLGGEDDETGRVAFLHNAISDIARRVSANPEVADAVAREIVGSPTMSLASPLEVGLAAAQALFGSGVARVVDGVVERERRYVERSAVRAEIAYASPDLLDQYVASAQLYGAESAAVARDVVQLVAGSDGRNPAMIRHIATWLHELYPGQDGVYWRPLPSQVRDRLVLSAVLRTPEIVSILPSVSATQASWALRSLVPACRSQPDLAVLIWATAATSTALCTTLFAVARASGGPASALLDQARQTVAAPGTPAAILRAVADGLGDIEPLFAGQDPDTAAALAEAFGRLAALSAPHLSIYADAVHHTGSIIEGKGRLAAALAAASDEVDLRRRVVAAQPGDEGAMTALARALVVWGRRLRLGGSPVRGQTAISEAIQLYRQVGGDAVDDAGLAVALAEQARLLDRLDRHHEAGEAAREAVARYREIAREQPDRYSADLAATLLIEASQLRIGGQQSAAVAAGADAVAIYEAVDRRVYAADLAYACLIHGMDLADFGLHRKGLDRLDRAVTLYRPLVSRDARFRSALASAHLGQSILLAETGQSDDALLALTATVRILRDLSGEDPVRYARALAGAMTFLAEMLVDLGRTGAATAHLVEACDIRERLLLTDPQDSTLQADLLTARELLERTRRPAPE